ncbi:protein PTST homolog 2, chloroplastic-like [Aristolochia californica]|uniref:protein PTST homolog 2, chloroplastic-like n=1 Tax=Aristolochia californica TaxID=171875 RepID=UPI0035DD63C1
MIANTSHSSLLLPKNSSSKLRRSCSRNPSLSRLVFSLRLVRSCRPLLAVTRVWESETHVEGSESRSVIYLEEEIFEFMSKSSYPERFPTKDELIAAGRMDLVEGILEEGGWLALGWGSDEENENDERNFQQTLSEDGRNGSSELAAPSGRLPESEMEMEGTGIEGILSGLEKERNLSFGMGQRRKEDELRLPLNVTVAGMGTSNQSTSLKVREDLFNDSGCAHFQIGSCLDYSTTQSSHESHMWRRWSSERAGYPVAEFEAMERPEDHSPFGDVTDKIYEAAEGSYGASDSRKKIDIEDKQNFQQQIRSRLQHLEQELSSVVYLLRSKTDVVASPKVQGNYPEDLEALSDALEYQQTEVIKTQNQLRSTRAKLAVLEGKIALEIIEAQRAVEEKQKKIDNAQKALSLLRTACIVWPNSASEVLLAGSFDGWTSQRRMERSNSGIFFLNLMLYPGHYEIKFIVDGVWRVDPLRPIVDTNGYENNLLVVS